MSVVEAAAAFRDALGEAARGHAREVLAAAVRGTALERVRAFRGAKQDAEDIVHGKVAEWVEEIVAGRVESGRENAWIGRVAWNAAHDWFRRRKTQREDPSEDVAEDPSVATAGFEDEVLGRERELDEGALVDRVLGLLEGMPAAYREVLEAHYLNEVPIADLVEPELQRDRDAGAVEAGPGGEDRARARCRARIDARLSRGRRWLQSRLVGRAR